MIDPHLDPPPRPSEDFSIKQYFREISRFKVLSAEEESSLALRIRKGDQDALDQLVRANLRFVVSVSRNYQNQGLPLGDLINEGNLGLLRAAKRFDASRNFKFISYAVWWIRQAILCALADQSRIVKLPLNRVGTIHSVRKTAGVLEQQKRRAPSLEEIARELDIGVVEVHESINLGIHSISLDSPSRGDADATMGDSIGYNDQESAHESMHALFLSKEITRALDSLSEREREVIILFFGIGQSTAHTLEEIASRFSISRERVRQVKERAIERLRHLSRSKRLKGAL